MTHPCSTYPYCGRDLFQQPETYFFAPAEAVGLLPSWRAARAGFLAALAKAVPAPAPVDDGPAPPGFRRIDDLLDQARALLAWKPAEFGAARALIDPLATRYEVHKRLFRHYGPDHRRHPQAPFARLADYIALTDALVTLAEAGSLRHLSTALKLLDALASVAPERYDRANADRLAALIGRERRLLDTLGAQDTEAAPCPTL